MGRERIQMAERTGQVWHAYLPDVRPGQLYGYRVHGPYDPERGHRFNPAKLLLDPYAKAVSGNDPMERRAVGLFDAREREAERDLNPDTADSAGDMPKCVVVESAFSWGDDRRPETPLEPHGHLRSPRQGHDDAASRRAASRLRGTYLGLATDPIIDHLLGLGVTAIELLPMQHFVTDRRLAERGLTNYWGYSPIGYFAPDARYATGGLGQQVAEFKSMVKRFHRAGIEVILDVVYNHTAEGNHLGPTLSFRGIDNAHLLPSRSGASRFYIDYTGTGNTLDIRNAARCSS